MHARTAMLLCCFGPVSAVGLRMAHAQASPEPPAPSAAFPAPAPPSFQPPPAARPPTPSPPPDDQAADDRSRWWPSRGKVVGAQPVSSDIPSASARDPSNLLPYERGILFIPHAGISLPWGSNTDPYTAGHGLGAILGFHVVPTLSLNGELNVEFMNPGFGASESYVDWTFSPLLQSRGPRQHFIFGMKIGAFSFTRSYGASAYESSSTFSTTGLVWGFNMAGFVPAGPIAIGCLISITMRHLSNNCGSAYSGTDTLCNGSTGPAISPASRTFDLSLAAIF